MKIKKNVFDTIAYYCFVIASFGFFAIVRVIITQAIKCALEDDK